MDEEEVLVRAIADNPADTLSRLAYADWLEERGDPRADYLRVQQLLAQRPPDESTYRELCEREQNLAPRLDTSWLQRVRRYTTAPPCRDLAVLVPELAPYRRVTTRLHPHRAVSPLPLWASKIGGRFLWPTSEAWPSCAECKVDLTPVLQLRSSDAPDIEYPAGADLLQLFWCPDEAAHDYQPAPRVWWRAAASLTVTREDAPDLRRFPRRSDWQGYIPFECAVYPERVIEYPIGDDLEALAGDENAARIRRLMETMDFGPTDDLGDRLGGEHGFDEPRSVVFPELGQCPGTKVGGKPGFTDEGRRFDHLVTFSTWEFDSANFRRWLAVEDQRLLAPPGEPLTWERLSRGSKFRPLQEVLGMQLGRTQRAHVFVCRDREPWDVIAYVNH